MISNMNFMVNNREKIADVAFALSLEKGFDNVSMKEIQKESGLGAGSIYYHFENKNEILVYITNKYYMNILNQLKKSIENFDGSFIEKMRFILNFRVNSNLKEKNKIYISGSEFSQKDYYMLITSIYHYYPEVRDMITRLHDNLYDFYYELIQEAIENKEIREDLDIRTLVIFIQTLIKGYIDLYVYQPNISFEELIDANLKMIQEIIKK